MIEDPQDDISTEQAAAEAGMDADHPARTSWAGASVLEGDRELTREEAAEALAQWERARAEQKELLDEQEIAAAGDPTNVDINGTAHFLHMAQTAENPPAWAETCGGCGKAWPCATYLELHPTSAPKPQVQETTLEPRVYPPLEFRPASQ